MQIEFIFKKESKKEVRVIAPSTLKITFINYESALGRHTVKPWKLGTLGKRKFYLLYRISNLKPTIKHIGSIVRAER